MKQSETKLILNQFARSLRSQEEYGRNVSDDVEWFVDNIMSEGDVFDVRGKLGKMKIEVEDVGVGTGVFDGDGRDEPREEIVAMCKVIFENEEGFMFGKNKAGVFTEITNLTDIVPDMVFVGEFVSCSVEDASYYEKPISGFYVDGIKLLMGFNYSKEYEKLNSELRQNPDDEEIRDRMRVSIERNECCDFTKCYFVKKL